MKEVRVADNLGDKERHMLPGEGSINFKALFTARNKNKTGS